MVRCMAVWLVGILAMSPGAAAKEDAFLFSLGVPAGAGPSMGQPRAPAVCFGVVGRDRDGRQRTIGLRWSRLEGGRLFAPSRMAPAGCPPVPPGLCGPDCTQGGGLRPDPACLGQACEAYLEEVAVLEGEYQETVNQLGVRFAAESAACGAIYSAALGLCTLSRTVLLGSPQGGCNTLASLLLGRCLAGVLMDLLDGLVAADEELQAGMSAAVDQFYSDIGDCCVPCPEVEEEEDSSGAGAPG